MVTESSVSKHLELSVRDFGPIAEANIDLRPMTVFVGPSNTGKSYLAILIYALHGFFAGRVTGSLPSPGTELGDYAVPLFNRGTPSELTISSADIDALLGWTEETLSVLRSKAAQTDFSPAMPESVSSLIVTRFRDIRGQDRLLNYEIARCFGRVDTPGLVRYGAGGGARVSVRMRVSETGGSPESFGYGFTIQAGVRDLHALVPESKHLRFDSGKINWSHRSIEQGLAWLSRQVRNADGEDRRQRFVSLLVNELAVALGTHVFDPLTRLGYYLPAARTGIMDSYLAVVGSLIHQTSQPGVRQDASLPTLSGNLSDFLLRLTSLSDLHRVDLDGDLAGNIERNILQGEVRMERTVGGLPEFLYRQNGWDDDMRLMNASSMVSELAPVVLYLRHVVGPGEVLIIEEPEAHLHPAMQVEFIRQLAAAVRAGVRIVITTHSEWVLEELSNLVHLSALPESKRKGIGGAEYALTPDQLGVWLFDPKEQPLGSVVREIPFDAEYGGFVSDYEDVAVNTHNDWAGISNRLSEIGGE